MIIHCNTLITHKSTTQNSTESDTDCCITRHSTPTKYKEAVTLQLKVCTPSKRQVWVLAAGWGQCSLHTGVENMGARVLAAHSFAAPHVFLL